MGLQKKVASETQTVSLVCQECFKEVPFLKRDPRTDKLVCMECLEKND